MPMTVKQIESARYGVDKERLSDGGGLYLRLFPNGAKRFQVQVARAPESKARGWVTLGDFPALSLKTARVEAARVRGMVEEGMSIEAIRAALGGEEKPQETGSANARPALSKKGIKSNAPKSIDPLLRDAARRWFDNKKHTFSNGKHTDQNWNTIATYILPLMGHQPITKIKRRDVIDALRPIWHAKHETAKRTLGRLKEIIELARLENDLEIANPAVFCTKTAFGYVGRITKHHAALSHERMPEFWHWLQTVNCDEQTRQATQLMVLTAKRTSETRFASWSLISADRSIWTTMAGRMKKRKPHRVPLSKQAKGVLENAEFLTGDRKLVFARPNTKSGTLCENALRDLVKRFEPELDLTGHGFRASFKTWARVSRRYNHDTVEYALSHVPEKLEEAYQRDDLLAERAELMQHWADFVTGGVNPASLRDALEGCQACDGGHIVRAPNAIGR